MSIKRIYNIQLVVKDESTVIQVNNFVADEVTGIAHEEKAKDLVPHMIRVYDMEQDRLQLEKETMARTCHRLAEKFLSKKRKPMATRLRVVK